MNELPNVLDEVVAQARLLSPQDKFLLVERLMADLKHAWPSFQPQPKKSLYGALADLGPAPSEEDIAEMRREAWANFPREIE